MLCEYEISFTILFRKMEKSLKAIARSAIPASTPDRRNVRQYAVKEREAAGQRAPRTENTPGDFFVDHTCM